jgi:hypothetical protein
MSVKMDSDLTSTSAPSIVVVNGCRSLAPVFCVRSTILNNMKNAHGSRTHPEKGFLMRSNLLDFSFFSLRHRGQTVYNGVAFVPVRSMP